MTSPRQSVFTGAVALLLFVGLAVGVLTGRLIFESRRYYRLGEELERDGNSVAAVDAYEQAVRAYVPGNQYCEKALWKLTLLAKSAVMRGDAVASRRLWEVVRRSILSVRHVRQPHEGYLLQAEKQILHLDRAAGSDGLNSVARPPDPSPLLSAFLFVGVILWIVGGLLWVASPGSRRTVGYAAISLSGVALWTLMALLA